MIWGYLLHLGYNMWSDRECDDEWRCPDVSAKPYLRFDEPLYDDLLAALAAAGANLVVLDLGEGVRYESHPELAVRGSWTTDRLKTELARMRALGLEPIPKLNFSTAHDAWLGPYERMVSTPAYYDVCADLIAEVSALFGAPRFFHIGMDEETAEHQRLYAYSVVRHFDLWWHDLQFLADAVTAAGSRPWVWSDAIWTKGDEYLQKMPKSVVQSNWYYGGSFVVDPSHVPGKPQPGLGAWHSYLDLDIAGYDQIPTGCTNPRWAKDNNFADTVTFSKAHLAPQRLLGFLQTVWRPTTEANRQVHREAIARLGEASS